MNNSIGLKDPIRLIDSLKNNPEDYWVKRGQSKALRLFKMMAKRVPAYKDFLKENKINPEKIKTIKDFKNIPLIDKQNYLRQYQLKDLCWDGKLEDVSWTISATSGSTGEPFYFPRTDDQDWQYALLAEMYLRTNFEIHKKSTLYIVAFPMGIWIGGLFTYQALKHLVKRGNYKLSIITPGINKLEVIKAVKKLGKDFDQIIIGSYGPFLKDIIDDGPRFGVDWKKYNLGFIFSAEGFSETFRDYIIKKTGIKNPYTGTLNHYGTVDLGTMSYETPLAILARRLTLKNKTLFESLFGKLIKLPTLTQYVPELFYFESLDGNLICSAFSGLPLVRYDLKDHGGILTLQEMLSKFSDGGINLLKEAEKSNIKNTVWNLPFVYVYERSDFSVSFFAFQIYPETIRKALQKSELENSVTGKFTMLVKYDKSSNQYLEINIELKANIQESEKLRKLATKLVVKQLLMDSSEYRKTTEEYSDKTTPKIIFWPYEDPLYFKPGTKQKWVKK